MVTQITLFYARKKYAIETNNARQLRENMGAWWRHQMETFSALLAICAGNSPVTRHRVNIGEAGDLRRHRDHYDVIVMGMQRKMCCDLEFLGYFQIIYLISLILSDLTHWGRGTHIFVCKLTIIGSDNGLLSQRRQSNIWTNAGILLIGTLGTNFSEILSEMHTVHSRKFIWKHRLRSGGHFVSSSM